MGWIANGVQIGIVARKPAEMVAFYRDVLLLPYAGPTQMTPENVTHYFNVGDARIKIADRNPAPETDGAPGGWNGATGLRWLTLDLDDIHAVADRCRAAASTFVAEPQESTIKPGLLYAIVLDPDGNWIELVQRPS